MSGIKSFNFPLFHTAAAALRALGWDIVSPAETDPPDVQAAAIASPDGKYDVNGKVGHETWGDMLARDVKQLADGIALVNGPGEGREPIDGICFLPGWERSRGARLEAFVGTLTGKTFYEYDPTTEIAYARGEGWVLGKLFTAQANMQAGIA